MVKYGEGILSKLVKTQQTSIPMNHHASLLAIILIVLSTNLSTSFTLQTSSTLLTRHLKKHSTRSTLHMARGYSDRKANSATIKSKRQNRVGETVRAEVAGILFNGYEVKVRYEG